MQFSIKGRLEDARMLTGKGRYVSDWNLPNQLYAHFVRSDRAHAELVSINKEESLKVPGAVAVYTGEDIAAGGLKPLPCALPVKGKDGAPLLVPPRPALAQGKVRFVGEPVAIVLAESATAAHDAAEALAIEYRELPAVTTSLDALAPGAPQLFDSVPGNCPFDYVVGDEAGTEAAFKNAASVVRIALDNTRVVGNPMEPRACVAGYDTAADAYTLYACTQGVNIMRGQLSAVLGVPPERIRIGAEEVGGGFGVRFNIYPEYCAALFAAKKTGRPVKWVGTRAEVFLADEQARDVLQHCEGAFDAEGRLKGLRFDFTANLGAYLAPTGPFVNTVAVVNCLSGVYNLREVFCRIRLAVTNTAPMAAYRGAGRPIMSYALERLAEQAAHELGIDPAELRRRNFIPRDKFPFKIVNGPEYDCGDFEGCLDKALAAADWKGFEARRKESASRGRLRGRGLATYIEATGAGFVPSDQVEIQFNGKEVHLLGTTHNHGQGHETTFAQLVSGVLGVPMESVRLTTADPKIYMTGNPTGGSRSLAGVGSVMMLAAKEAAEKGKALAAEDLETAVADIEFVEGKYRIKGTDRSLSFVDLVAKYKEKLNVKFETRFGSTYPNGCHIAEVEIEPETGEASVVSYIACDDAGNIINPQIVEGQMQGGVTQGAGQVFEELAVYDPESGQLLTGSFMDYTMPRATLVNGFKLLHHPVPTKSNPLGAKGVGEAGVSGSLPSLMNAVVDALRGAGVTHFDMPATPARVWRAIQEAKAGKPRALAVEQR